MQKFGIHILPFILLDAGLKLESQINELGISAYLDNISAATGRENLKRIDGQLLKHRNNATKLKERLVGLGKVRFLTDGPKALEVPWPLNTAVEDKDRWKAAHNKIGVSCQRLHLRCDLHAAFPNADRLLGNAGQFDRETLIFFAVGG
jgi:dTDP-4-amino-4,6-dideoxygalactose transaminase